MSFQELCRAPKLVRTRRRSLIESPRTPIAPLPLVSFSQDAQGQSSLSQETLPSLSQGGYENPISVTSAPSTPSSPMEDAGEERMEERMIELQLTVDKLDEEVIAQRARLTAQSDLITRLTTVVARLTVEVNMVKDAQFEQIRVAKNTNEVVDTVVWANEEYEQKTNIRIDNLENAMANVESFPTAEDVVQTVDRVDKVIEFLDDYYPSVARCWKRFIDDHSDNMQ